MAIHNIGRVGIIFYESWEKGKKYGYLDYLRDNKNSYMCVKEHIANDSNRPNGGDSEFWKIIVENADLSSVQKAIEDVTKVKAESITAIDTAKESAIIEMNNNLSTGGYAKTSDLDNKADKSELDALKDKSILLKEYVDSVSTIKHYSVTIDNLVIPANDRLNHQSSALPNLPEGWIIETFKQISILKGSNATDESWKKVIIQSFSTASNSTKPNISLYNFGDTDAIVKVTVQCLCRKISEK